MRGRVIVLNCRSCSRSCPQSRCGGQCQPRRVRTATKHVEAAIDRFLCHFSATARAAMWPSRTSTAMTKGVVVKKLAPLSMLSALRLTMSACPATDGPFSARPTPNTGRRRRQLPPARTFAEPGPSGILSVFSSNLSIAWWGAPSRFLLVGGPQIAVGPRNFAPPDLRFLRVLLACGSLSGVISSPTKTLSMTRTSSSNSRFGSARDPWPRHPVRRQLAHAYPSFPPARGRCCGQLVRGSRRPHRRGRPWPGSRPRSSKPRKSHRGRQ